MNSYFAPLPLSSEFQARLAALLCLSGSLDAGILHVPEMTPLCCTGTNNEVQRSVDQICAFSITPIKIVVGRRFGSVIWRYTEVVLVNTLERLQFVYDYGASIGCIWYGDKWKRPTRDSAYIASAENRPTPSADFLYYQVLVSSTATDADWERVKALQCVAPTAKFLTLWYCDDYGKNATPEEEATYRAKLGL